VREPMVAAHEDVGDTTAGDQRDELPTKGLYFG
jgi:hypothetical protein